MEDDDEILMLQIFDTKRTENNDNGDTRDFLKFGVLSRRKKAPPRIFPSGRPTYDVFDNPLGISGAI